MRSQEPLNVRHLPQQQQRGQQQSQLKKMHRDDGLLRCAHADKANDSSLKG
jgi:hypothetical protein